MFQLAVTGGKGGTGKSFVAVNLAYHLARNLPGRSVLLADLDIEAPNDHVLLGVGLGEGEDIDIFFPRIDYGKCTSCGACAKVCDTGAIIMGPGRPPFVFPRLCSGCKACMYACPYGAISPGLRAIGSLHLTRVSVDGAGFTLLTSVLREGEEHTAPGVVYAKRRALGLGADVVIVDTGAGTGNSISIALRGSDLVVAVTEPTPMGLHDLEAIMAVARGMGLRVWVVVNKSTIGPAGEAGERARGLGAERVYMIPYTRGAVESYARGVPLLALNPRDPAALALRRLGDDILGLILG